MKIISRADARAQGLKVYFTGVECPNLHVAERYVSNSSCSACLRENNEVHSRERNARYHQKNREAVRERQARHYAARKAAKKAAITQN